ncbi:hypothetical protein EYF80_049502 [Liparis tanakae]|uniref:Uncharacterized protein n=1 Tax=Liparis tanakae TaxID=230148 RepID=A0A4Z2FHF7_9TELE|nr:hypothetical protein EYF80_049502 [Liparis tanakae]
MVGATAGGGPEHLDPAARRRRVDSSPRAGERDAAVDTSLKYFQSMVSKVERRVAVAGTPAATRLQTICIRRRITL